MIDRTRSGPDRLNIRAWFERPIPTHPTIGGGRVRTGDAYWRGAIFPAAAPVASHPASLACGPPQEIPPVASAPCGMTFEALRAGPKPIHAGVQHPRLVSTPTQAETNWPALLDTLDMALPRMVEYSHEDRMNRSRRGGDRSLTEPRLEACQKWRDGQAEVDILRLLGEQFGIGRVEHHRAHSQVSVNRIPGRYRRDV